MGQVQLDQKQWLQEPLTEDMTDCINKHKHKDLAIGKEL